ncbi:hypothetical protein J4443_03770 [Candidatus Woesearchaeota archaeon]|nr:hypothetical protein [Candidatus Woesearchaeota archaeon]
MTPIEIFAWVVVVVSLIKILVILKNPERWIDIIEVVWKNPKAFVVVSLVLAGIVFYQLLQEISIVQIFGVILFVVLISAAGMAVYSKEVLQLGRKLLKEKNIARKAWLSILIWVLLIILVIKELI